MVDPPPKDPSGHLQPGGESSQPLVPQSDLPGNANGAPQPAVDSARPPLAELNPNGDPISSTMAASKAATLKQPAMEVPPRKLMKKKSSSKLHPYHVLPREDHHSCNLPQPGMEELNPRAEVAVVVQPLQTIEAENVSFVGEDDDSWSDDEEVFDIEEYQLDDRRRAELKCLMDKYEVYDEEQLRLAMKRERRLEKMSQRLAGNLPPSSESAPTSPSGNQSRFIPPSHADFQPISEDLHSKNISYYEGNPVSSSPLNTNYHISQHLSNTIAHDAPPTISMQPQSIHVTPIDVDNPPTNTNPPHAATISSHANPSIHVTPIDVDDPTINTNSPHAITSPPHTSPIPMQPPPPHAIPNPMHLRPPCQNRPPPPCTQPNTRTLSPIRVLHPGSTIIRAMNKPNPALPRPTRALWSSVPTLLPPPMVAPSHALPLLITLPKRIKLNP